jgi:hypothetical protein
LSIDGEVSRVRPADLGRLGWRYAADPPSANTSGIGYLLKQRVADVEEYADCLRRVAADGTAPDPQVVSQLLARRHSDPLDRLTPRERGDPGVTCALHGPERSLTPAREICNMNKLPRAVTIL